MAEVRDQRVDRAITWGLTTLAGIAFTWGGHSFSSLSDEVHALGTRISVIEQHAQDEGKDIERRLKSLEEWRDRVERTK